MSPRNTTRRALGLIGTMMLAALIGYGVHLHLEQPSVDESNWPIGSPEDIERLAERDDLNVLFILVDTLRADRLGAYGYERDTSPNLDRLSSVGVRFARHHAQSSWTKASMASLWTGHYPTRTGVRQHDDIIPEDAEMAAEIFRDNGLRTVGLYRNGWVAPTFGFHQGFDTYMRPPSLGIPPSVQRENPVVAKIGTDDDVIAATREFLRLDGDEPWFLYLHLMDLHEYTYDMESALFGGTYSDIYDNSIRWTDSTLALLFDMLFEWGFSRNTLVVITSDHGEAFRLESGVVIHSRTRNVDIFPTVFDLLGIEPLAETDGVSLKPDILAAARFRPIDGPRRTGFAQLNQNWGQRKTETVSTESIVDGPFRYLRRVSKGRVVEELFDATSDSNELVDISESKPEVLARLRAEVNREMERGPVWGEPEVREINELELNQLRALGYEIP